MKADFEKGTKVCSRCKRELPISEFNKNKRNKDGLQYYCKKCKKVIHKAYLDKNTNTFGRTGNKRGNSGISKRDYELTEQQLARRNKQRDKRKNKYKRNRFSVKGILVWYDEMLDDLESKEYNKIYQREYMRQRNCAIRGNVGERQPSEHFLFDFDLEQMLKDNTYYSSHGDRIYIEKWWDGTIRHWTVNDGVWKNKR